LWIGANYNHKGIKQVIESLQEKIEKQSGKTKDIQSEWRRLLGSKGRLK